MAKDRLNIRARTSPFFSASAVLLGGLVLAVTRPMHAGAGVAAIGALVLAVGIVTGATGLLARWRHREQALVDLMAQIAQENRTSAARERHLRRIIETAGDAYIEISGAGVVEQWNAKAVALFGYTSESAVGLSLFDTVVPEPARDHCRTHLEIARSIGATQRSNDSGAHRFELVVVDRDGDPFPVEITAWAETDANGGGGLSLFVSDLRDHRDMEERLQQALIDEREAVLRLQELDRVKNEFVSSISHELRSPLTSTLGYLELLADGDAGDLTTQQARMIEVAERNAKRLQTLIEDLLTLSRIESGSFSVRYKPVDLAPLVRRATQHTTMRAAERSIHLTMDVPDGLGVCPGDESQLVRALGNIIENAVKFTPPDGTVSVSARRTVDQVVVVVTDTGVGIPPDEQHRLFHRFFRSSIAVEQAHQGAGLGLTISKAIVEHHGGTIQVSSTLGAGTSVTIVLPALAMTPPVVLPA